MAPELDVGEFLSYVDAEIANPQSSKGWIDYCNKVREWVVQKYKVVEASYPKNNSSQELEVSQEVSAAEANPEVLEEVSQTAADILASSFSEEVSEAQRTGSEQQSPSLEKIEPEPEATPHEGITVDESTETENFGSQASLTKEKPGEIQQKEEKASFDVEKKAGTKGLQGRGKSSLPIPQGLSAGWLISMVIAMCFLLPWVWLVLNLFWTIISKLVPGL